MNKFKYNKFKQKRLNTRNARLLLINWSLNHIMKFIAGTDLNDIEKLVF